MGFVRRRTRRRTAMVVGGMAYAAGRSRRDDEAPQGYDDQEAGGYEQGPPVPPAPPVPAPSPAPAEESNVDQLKELAELHSSGALSDDEVAAAKAKILGS